MTKAKTQTKKVIKEEVKLVTDLRLIQSIWDARLKSPFVLDRPESEFPELIVTAPDEWESVLLAPLYDCHIGAGGHAEELLLEHLNWIKNTENVLTFNGGDMLENATKLSVGAGVYEQDYKPDSQLAVALQRLSGIAHKMMFSLPGNHEDRTDIMGLSMARWLAAVLQIEYFSDYCFCTIKWRGNNFRVLAHHGTGAAQTAGAQRMAARKDLAWAKPFDIFWTGHLHAPLVDPISQTDFDQASGRMVERNGLAIISPSYLKYFNSYAAKMRLPASLMRGLTVVELHENGRMDTSVHVHGKRL